MEENKMTVLENELVPVYVTDYGEKVVYGRELHNVLNVKSNYREWFLRRVDDCEAIDGEDFTTVEFPTLSGGTAKKDHVVKLDIAKEMAMLERNDIGKSVRKYFIGVEKKYSENQFDRKALSANMQMFYLIADSQAKIEIEQKAQSERIEKVEGTVKEMKDIFITPVKDWQQNIVDMVRKISLNSEYDYKDLWSILYDELETTAKCSLNRLVANKKARMEKAGNTKAAIEAGTKKIAIIAEKPQLRVIFEGIVKRYAMKYIA